MRLLIKGYAEWDLSKNQPKSHILSIIMIDQSWYCIKQSLSKCTYQILTPGAMYEYLLTKKIQGSATVNQKCNFPLGLQLPFGKDMIEFHVDDHMLSLEGV